MGKNDLIEKINARVKSQMNSLSARAMSRTGGQEKERASDRAEKRITNARTGTVVVRRRGAPRAAESAKPDAEGAATEEESARADAPTLRRGTRSEASSA